MDKATKYGVIAVAVSVVLASAITRAPAQDIHFGTGLICDTAEQVEQVVALAKKESDASAAIEAVNSAAGNPQACVVATIYFVGEEEIRQVGTFRIIRVLVVGFDDGENTLPVQPPQLQFMILEPDGEEV